MPVHARERLLPDGSANLLIDLGERPKRLFDASQGGAGRDFRRAWISGLLPYTGKMADDIAIVRSMHTEAINHEPAITFIQTGNMIAGKPCIGSWIAYGLGSMNRDLPTFVVMNATHSDPKANVQAISARLWSSGFLSAEYSGVALRSGGDPVLYINNPDGVPTKIRRRMLDDLHAVFPETRGLVEETWIRRLPRGFPYWKPGRLAIQDALARPAGNVFFAGDWIEYPSTDTAVRSGQIAARAILARLDGEPGDKGRAPA